MMILVGSQAAKLRGHLPEWRNGYTDDHDIYAPKDTADEWIDGLLYDQRVSELSDAYFGFGAILNKSQVISVVYPDIVYEAYLKTSDLLEVSHLGTNFFAISEASQLAVKLGYLTYNREEKMFKDIDFWYNNLYMSGGFGPEHLAVYEAMKKLARSRYGPTSSGLRLAPDAMVESLLQRKLHD